MLDLNRVINQACSNRLILEKYAEALADGRRAERLAEAECRLCHYSRAHVGGQTITTWSCGLCGVTSRHGSTAVPCLCVTCARLRHLCRLCGSDLDDKSRRKL